MRRFKTIREIMALIYNKDTIYNQIDMEKNYGDDWRWNNGLSQQEKKELLEVYVFFSVSYGDSRTILNNFNAKPLAYAFGLNGFMVIFRNQSGRLNAYKWGRRGMQNYWGSFTQYKPLEVLKDIKSCTLAKYKYIDKSLELEITAKAI